MYTENERYSRIRLFSAFLESLNRISREEGTVLALTWGRQAFNHRLASYLHRILAEEWNESPGKEQEDVSLLRLPGNLYCDTAIHLPATSGRTAFMADVVLHDRATENPENDRLVMATVVRDRYLTEAEQLALHDLQENKGCSLALAISLFIPQKPYLLIYRVDNERIEYYHYHLDTGSCTLFKQRDIQKNDDSGQLSLGIPSRRKSKKDASAL